MAVIFKEHHLYACTSLQQAKKFRIGPGILEYQ